MNRFETAGNIGFIAVYGDGHYVVVVFTADKIKQVPATVAAMFRRIKTETACEEAR